MIYAIIDCETDGLLKQATKIHCLSYQLYSKSEVIGRGTIVDYAEMRKFLLFQENIICHNLLRFDKPIFKKILGVDITSKCFDTLGISWYLFPNRKKHGLEAWGVELGVEKPVIEDWKNSSLEDIIHRCQEDVEINVRVFVKFMNYLSSIYEDAEAMFRLIGYVEFKMDCLREQEEQGLPVDVYLCERTLNDLEYILDEKTTSLSQVMPNELGRIIKSKPKFPYKQSGELSTHGENWFELLTEMGLPIDTEEIREETNPGSHDQLKKWLLSLGWKPITFKISKNTGKKLAQVSLPFGEGLCPSVKDLYEVEPALVDLEDFYVIKHRIGILKSFLKSKDENNLVYATAHGFTNTMRLTHSVPIVNLPGVNKAYGKEIRACLKVLDENYIMMGCDVSGLEDNTKQHYIYFFDPDYVTQMRVPGFDPHIDIAVLAGLLTPDDEIFFKWYDGKDKTYIFTQDEKGRFKTIKIVRGQAKVVNFSATYGAGPPKMAETLKCSLSFATNLHKIYWERNKAVKLTAKACRVKIVQYIDSMLVDEEYETEHGIQTKKVRVEVLKSQKWLYNPVSGFWMFLKAEKDRFSTLNQSTGVYVFDTWLRQVRTNLKPLGVKIPMQYHDEFLLYCRKELEVQVENIINQAMLDTNALINLNVKITNSIDKGINYAVCH